MNQVPQSHLPMPTDDIALRSMTLYLIPEDLARAQMRARIDEADRWRLASAARLARSGQRVRKKTRRRRRLREE